MSFRTLLPLLVLFAAGCKKKPPEPPPPPPAEICDNGIDDDLDGNADCDDSDCTMHSACKIATPEICDNGVDDDGDFQTDCADSDCANDPACVRPVEDIVKQNFERVKFDYDSTSLAGDSMSALRDNSKLLAEFSNIRVEIQGHADERGTTDYNMALGQKRAEAIRKRLIEMGAPSSQLTIISYGEERPLERGSSESVWSVNRRAEFRITSGGDPQRIEGTIK